MNSNWKEFTSKQDSFVVALPAVPKVVLQDNNYDFGKVTIRAYITSKPTMDCRVAVHIFPEPFASRVKSRELIELLRDGMAANVKGKAEDIQEVSLDGYPGEEFTIRLVDPTTKKPVLLRMRLFAADGRVYQLVLPPRSIMNRLSKRHRSSFGHSGC
jgi:hypothetical protein